MPSHLDNQQEEKKRGRAMVLFSMYLQVIDWTWIPRRESLLSFFERQTTFLDVLTTSWHSLTSIP